MSEPKVFEVGEYKFIVGKLKVKASLKGLKLVGGVLLPALAEARNAPDGQLGNAVQKAVESLDCLPELLDLFTGVTKFTSPMRENPTALAPCVEDVFAGYPDHVVLFLVECVQAEYGRFFLGNGPLAGLLAKATAKAPAAAG